MAKVRHETRAVKREASNQESSALWNQPVSITPVPVPSAPVTGKELAKKRVQMVLGSRFSMLIVLSVFAFLLRLYRLDGQSLWLDELNTWWLVANASWGALLNELWRSESAYPLYHLLLKGWIVVAGDSAWAMRLPSALAGAGAVAAVYLAGSELSFQGTAARDQRPVASDSNAQKSSTVARNWLNDSAHRSKGFGVSGAPLEPHPAPLLSRPTFAALLLTFSPFALWYAQEVKTYSLLLCTSALTIWLLLRALRRNDRLGWLAFAVVALLSVFVHRFALLLLMGCALAWLSYTTSDRSYRSLRVARLGFLVAIIVASASLVWQMTEGLGEEGATTGEHIAAGPLQASWITIWRFLLDRGPWEAPWLWLLPGALLALWGSVMVLRDALRGDWRARALVCCGAIPCALFLVQLWWTRLYEPRYLIIVYPVWMLVLAYPLQWAHEARRATNTRLDRVFNVRLVSIVCFLLVLISSVAALLQPVKGLWSGDPVKEQYREAIRYLVERAHPEDVIILHPEYLRTAWDYYAPRMTTGALPSAVAFDAFKKRQTEFSQRDWDTSRDRALSGHFRSFLLIAPAHARTVDPINPAHPEDEYGLVGLYYQYSWEQNKWPCGGMRFNGVHVLCQASPEAYVTGEEALPSVPLEISFGDNIMLRGTRIPVGTVPAGSTVPITLYWDVSQQPSEDYFVFLHLCQDCTIPPAASDDGSPLGGGVPTSIWKPGHPVYDERTVVLPRDLAPGRYSLLLGLYRPGDPSLEARLSVRGGDVIDDNRVIIGSIDVTRP